jgi:nicotinate-nucleotide pyrophosphorylase (carboxylating)
MTKLNIPYTVIRDSVKTALFEDIAGQRDITSLLILESTPANAYIITREDMILCGRAWVNEVFQQIDTTIRIDWKFNDGDSVSTNQTLCKLHGPARSLLTGERTALNFLQTLSATATVTHKYVEMLKDTKTKLLDTRKTIPGLRLAQKYAVRCGGGCNHRMGLYDAFLIKENHIRAFGSIPKVILTAKKTAPDKKVEIEVKNLQQLQESINAKADMVMLDNFTLEQMQKAVAINKNQVKLEVSGNINLENLKDIASTGVDYISVGALTKNVIAIDLSMQFE